MYFRLISDALIVRLVKVGYEQNFMKGRVGKKKHILEDVFFPL